MFGRATITLGIGPLSSCTIICRHRQVLGNDFFSRRRILRALSWAPLGSLALQTPFPDPGYWMCVFAGRPSKIANIYNVQLPSTVTLGGAYDGNGASPVSQQDHVICCSRRQACASGGVRYSCERQRLQHNVPQLAGASQVCVCRNRKLYVAEGKESASAISCRGRSSVLQIAKYCLQVRHPVGREVTARLVSAFVLSRLDYCNSLLAGLP